MAKSARYRLTADLVAAHAGASGVVAIDDAAIGRTWALHPERPDARANEDARAVLAAMGTDPQPIQRAEDPPPQNDVLLVKLSGPIEETGGYHDPCAGWTAGHDTIYEGLAAAFEIGDAVLWINSPGGVVSGGPEAMRRAREMKVKHGRRCIGYLDLGASMAMWWAVSICDEIYVPKDGRAGAVGCRGTLSSMAEALKKEGVDVWVAQFPDGKATGMPELPISDEGKARADRDVRFLGEMFFADVCASATGTRAGLTPDVLKSYRADCYTGQAAVDAGFADGVSTLEEVMSYALATAGQGADMTIKARAEGAPPEPDDKNKPEGEEPAPDSKPEPGEKAKTCARCDLALDPMDSFCRKCGTATVPPEGEDDAPDSSARGSALAGKIAAAHAPIAPAARADGAYSAPALKAALATATGILDAVAGLVGAKSHAEIVGAVKATAHDAGKALRYRAERDAARADKAEAERKDLAIRLIGLGIEGWQRGDIFADTKGDRFTDLFGAMPLPTLRGMVERFEATRAAKADPFTPSREKATAAEDANRTAPATGDPADGQIVNAMSLPAVKALIKSNPGLDPKAIARTYLKTVASNGAGGVQ